jgi:O-6-methylguanine DNA methyltransferase
VLAVGVERYAYEVDGWGVGEITLEGRLLLAHDLPSPAQRPAARLVSRNSLDLRPTTSDVSPTTPKGGVSPPGVTLADHRIPVWANFVSDFIDRVRRQLDGEQITYHDVPLDLSWCTPFQGELAAALLAVPWGEIVSYGELAALAGRPGAARAAGSFCAQNRFALVMPCHRVVGAAGIGGYGDSGVKLKRRLLALEGVEL